MSCNNNNKVTRIYVNNGCNPCNPCTSCNRCACDCTCDQPDYDTGGCITIQPTDCIKYNGPALTDYGITSNETLTSVIQKLAGEAPLNSQLFSSIAKDVVTTPYVIESNTPVVAMLQEDFQRDLKLWSDDFVPKINAEVENIKKEHKKNLLKDIKAEGDDIISAEYKSKKLTVGFNTEAFFEQFIDFIKSDPVNASKMAQLLDYVTKKGEDFILYPYNITLETSNNSIRVKWSIVEDAVKYHVFYKKDTDGDFIKAGETPALGITIPNLDSQTTYQVYVISEGSNDQKSLPSSIQFIEIK